MSDGKSGNENDDGKGDETGREAARTRLGATGRNEACPCGSGKKYKKCHLQEDEQTSTPPTGAPTAQELIEGGWRLFEQRRPGAAEKEFRAALALEPALAEALVGIGMARGLLVDRVDELQRAMGVLAFVLLRLDPDGKEFGAEVALLGRFEVQMSAIERTGEVIVFIEQPLGGIRVGVNHDGSAVHREGIFLSRRGLMRHRVFL